MVIKTIKLLFKNNASETEKDFQGLNDTLDDTAKANDKVNKSFDTGATFAQRYGEELQPLTTRIGEAEDRLYELALAGDTTSKEYQELLNKVSEYRKVQIQTDQVVDGASQTMTNKLGSALNGVASGFAVTQGAIALFGEENEALNESLLKVQAALAIQQGVKGLTDSYKELSIGTKIASVAQGAFAFVTAGGTTALKLFRLALISTGIGALIVGIGLLIANFDKLINVFDPVIQGLKDFADWIGITNFEEEEREQKRIARAEAQRKRTKAEIERETKLHDLRKRNFQDQQNAYNRRIALLQAEGKETGILEQIKELNAIKQSKRDIAYAKGQIQRIRLLKRRLNGQSAEAKAFEQQIDAFNQAIKDSNQQILDSNNQIKINEINNNKAKADSYKEYIDKKEEQRKKDEERERDRLKNLENLENDFLDRIAKIEEENYQNTLSDEERELRAVQDKYFELETLAEGNAEQLNIIEEARLNAENEIKLKYQTEAYNNKKALDDQAEADRKEKEAKDKESRDKEKAEAKALQDYKVNVVQGGLSAINDIAQLFAKGNEKQQKRAFQIQKAVGIAQATINTAQAITKVFAETTDFTPTQSLRIANAVGIGIAGAAQIASIASQQFQGGGDLETPGDIGAGAGGEAVAPQFNVVGDSGVNQLAQLQQQPVQAYVVSGEVTTSQALDRNRVENATL